MNGLSARCACGGEPRKNVGVCSRCYSADYYQKHRTARAEAQRRYRAKHREAYAAREAKRRQALREIPEQKLVRVPVPGWGVRVL